MSWVADVFSGGLKGILNPIKEVMDEFHLSGEEKNNFVAKMEGILQRRDSEIEQTIRTELSAKASIIMAEMKQEDNFTKRARPTVVYVGLAVIVLNYCLFPNIAKFFGVEFVAVELPTEFWIAWGGIVATWTIGRSAEKRGTRNKATSLITGSQSVTDILG